jgi:hypothetical protein
LLTTLIGGEPYVVFRPAVERIGLSYSRQVKKIKERSWANCGLKATVGEDGKIRDMVVMDVPTFLMWLATVNESRVSEDARSTLIAYQRETTRAVYGYWTRGGAINPRANTEQLAELQERVAELEAIYPTWRAIMSEGTDFSVRDAAAILNRDHTIITGQNILFAYMRSCRMLDSRNRPYADHKHHLVRRMGVEYIDQLGETRIGGSQVRVTAEGMAYLHRRLTRSVPA